MRKVVVLMIFLVLNFTLSAEIVNKNRPQLGEWDFKLQEAWSIDSAGDEPFMQLTSMKVRDNGNIYVFDYKNFKFFVFDPTSGELLHTFGKKGQGPGEINMVLDFFFSKDTFIVYDMGKLHFFSIDQDFKYIKSKVLANAFGNPPSFFLDENRYVSVPRNLGEPNAPKRIDIFDLSQRSSITIAGGSPAAVKKKSSGGSGSRAMFIGGGGTLMKKDPSMILNLNGDTLYYGENENYLIKAINLSGEEILSFSIKGKKRKKISNAYKKNNTRSFRVSGYSTNQESINSLMNDTPDFSTYFYRIHIDKNGFIYVFISDVENSRDQEIDIFSPEGKYLYNAKISVPTDYTLKGGGFVFGDNGVYVVLEDIDGELKLVKYQASFPKN